MPSSIAQLSQYCFFGSRSLSTIAIESDSKLALIASSSFENGSSLALISILSLLKNSASVVSPDTDVFRQFRFESGSKLSVLEGDVFSGCSFLSEIWIPSSLRIVWGQYQRLLEIPASEDVGVDLSLGGTTLQIPSGTGTCAQE
jgi:hypothetical protein